jgi:transposase
MTLNGAMNGRAFEVFIEHFLVPNLWEGAVVVMDNLPAHKLGNIEPLIQAAGASLLNLSPPNPDFNPIELWYRNSSFLYVSFHQQLPLRVDILLATVLDFFNHKHFKNWFTSCCYCTS